MFVGKFDCCKRPSIEQIILSFGHTGEREFASEKEK